MSLRDEFYKALARELIERLPVANLIASEPTDYGMYVISFWHGTRYTKICLHRSGCACDIAMPPGSITTTPTPRSRTICWGTCVPTDSPLYHQLVRALIRSLREQFKYEYVLGDHFNVSTRVYELTFRPLGRGAGYSIVFLPDRVFLQGRLGHRGLFAEYDFPANLVAGLRQLGRPSARLSSRDRSRRS